MFEAPSPALTEGGRQPLTTHSLDGRAPGNCDRGTAGERLLPICYPTQEHAEGRASTKLARQVRFARCFGPSWHRPILDRTAATEFGDRCSSQLSYTPSRDRDRCINAGRISRAAG